MHRAAAARKGTGGPGRRVGVRRSRDTTDGARHGACHGAAGSSVPRATVPDEFITRITSESDVQSIQRTRRVRQPGDIPFVLHALVYTAAIRVALWVTPSTARLLNFVASRVAASASRPGAPTVDQLAWATRAAGRRVPRATCLVQALSAQLLLARHGHRSQLRIGVNRGPDGEFRAHAWVEVDDRIVVGARRGTWYRPLPDLDPVLQRAAFR
jgi:hypothetical protein